MNSGTGNMPKPPFRTWWWWWIMNSQRCFKWPGPSLLLTAAARCHQFCKWPDGGSSTVFCIWRTARVLHTIWCGRAQPSIHLRLAQDIRAEVVPFQSQGSGSAFCAWCNSGPCSGMLPKHPQKMKAPRWFLAKLCAKCTLHNCYCLRQMQKTCVKGCRFQNCHPAAMACHNSDPGHSIHTITRLMSCDPHLFSVSFWMCEDLLWPLCIFQPRMAHLYRNVWWVWKSENHNNVCDRSIVINRGLGGKRWN